MALLSFLFPFKQTPIFASQPLMTLSHIQTIDEIVYDSRDIFMQNWTLNNSLKDSELKALFINNQKQAFALYTFEDKNLSEVNAVEFFNHALQANATQIVFAKNTSRNINIPGKEAEAYFHFKNLASETGISIIDYMAIAKTNKAESWQSNFSLEQINKMNRANAARMTI